jgi:hypothetical protein
MMQWLLAVGVSETEIDLEDTEELLKLWRIHYDPEVRPEGMTKALRNYYIRLDKNLDGLLNSEPIIIASENIDSGVLEERKTINRYRLCQCRRCSKCQSFYH